MKEYVEKLAADYIERYQLEKGTVTHWGKPLFAYAFAGDPRFADLKRIISPTHGVPQDFLEDARTVIAYFLPFEKSIPLSNVEGKYSSREWAVSYLETNQLIADLNQYLHQEFGRLGYLTSMIPATHNFDEERLISDWSHRHVAYIAGLGKFGLNNLLITAKGSGGRIGSIVTTMELEPTEIETGEYCLYKAKGKCQLCIRRCVGDALHVDSFDRKKCYDILLENDRRNPDLGLVDVCGKCAVDLPCTFRNPNRSKVNGHKEVD